MSLQTQPLIKTPENMAEALKLGYDAQQASDAVAQVGLPWERQKAGEEIDEAVRYKISPREGQLTARRHDPQGRSWVRTDEEVNVTADTPFVATTWTYNRSGTDGIEFVFYSSNMNRDNDGQAANPVWQLSISARELDNIKLVEEKDGEIVSEWLGRQAVIGSVSRPTV